MKVTEIENGWKIEFKVMNVKALRAFLEFFGRYLEESEVENGGRG